MLCTIFLFGIGVGLLYLYFVWTFNYWKKRGVPFIKPIPVVGAFPGAFLQKKNLAYEINDVYQ